MARRFPVLCVDTGEVCPSYSVYINSRHWRRTKILFKHSKHHQGRCYVCGRKDRLHLHHKTYERIGHEELTDLQELCENCHTWAHQLVNAPNQDLRIDNVADELRRPDDNGDTFAFENRQGLKQTRKERAIREKDGWGAVTNLAPRRYECRFCRKQFVGVVSARGINCPTCEKKRSPFDVRLSDDQDNLPEYTPPARTTKTPHLPPKIRQRPPETDHAPRIPLRCLKCNDNVRAVNPKPQKWFCPNCGSFLWKEPLPS
jgi:Zn finger protein HypA/HybF involved in hydrogenase expression